MMDDYGSRLAMENNLRWAAAGAGAQQAPFLAQTWMGPSQGPPGYAPGGMVARCAKPVYPDYFVKAYGTNPNEKTKALWF